MGSGMQSSSQQTSTGSFRHVDFAVAANPGADKKPGISALGWRWNSIVEWVVPANFNKGPFNSYQWFHTKQEHLERWVAEDTIYPDAFQEYMHIYIYIYIFIFTHTSIYDYVYMYVCIGVYNICMYIHMFVHVYVYGYIFIYIYVYIHMCIYTYIHTYVYTYIDTYVYIHTYA